MFLWTLFHLTMCGEHRLLYELCEVLLEDDLRGPILRVNVLLSEGPANPSYIVGLDNAIIWINRCVFVVVVVGVVVFFNPATCLLACVQIRSPTNQVAFVV